jgi:hypothetical protein
MYLVKPRSSCNALPVPIRWSKPSGNSRVIDRAGQHQLLQLALMIEPDELRISEWWHQTPIAELGGDTADALVSQGMQHLVEAFLLAILFGDRG